MPHHFARGFAACVAVAARVTHVQKRLPKKATRVENKDLKCVENEEKPNSNAFEKRKEKTRSVSKACSFVLIFFETKASRHFFFLFFNNMMRLKDFHKTNVTQKQVSTAVLTTVSGFLNAVGKAAVSCHSHSL